MTDTVGAQRAIVASGSPVWLLWQIGGAFFSGDYRWRARGLTLLLVALAIAQIAVQLMLNIWSGAVFNAIEQRDTAGVLRQVAVFAGLATAFLALAGYHLFTKMRIQVEWRAWITNRLVSDWLAQGRNAELAQMGSAHSNPDQRISEDVRIAAEGAVDFAEGIFHAVLQLAGFVGVLWLLSGSLTIAYPPYFDISIPGYLVWAAFAYAGVGTLLTFLLGKPLVQLNQDKLSNEAGFRLGLLKISETGNDAALPDCTDADRRDLGDSFARVIVTWRQLMLRTRRLSFMTSGYSILATGLPVLIAAPDYFAQVISLGGLMQATAAFITVQETLSWFVNNYARFADWSASVRRISTFRVAIDELIVRDEPPPDTAVAAEDSTGD